ncbi:kelch repeat-containing protein At3g27220-like isoform X2 [Salvia miltiorrhiza]|uniref:kelch repeat-containing protein At3g27220-like isoform X2 n=1 Tax=Salvia miltiorrhiza TaxID=226208 RepID=UPI0025AC9A96|nr:kelch repeat-containing protein At3g27220-like isoform X2 [Salvia miltiorrhiza]
MLSAGKRASAKSTLIFMLLSLVGIALTVDFFWASSSSSSPSSSSPFLSNWAQEKNQIFVFSKPKIDNEKQEKVEDEAKKNNVPELELSGTFADLPAPELEWEQMPSAPVPRLDGSAIQIEDLLYVFCGYGTLDHVMCIPTSMSTISRLEIGLRDLRRQKRWRIRIWEWQVMEEDMCTSCLGSMALSARLLRWLFHLSSTRRRGSGRAFPHCRLLATQLWRGRLHVMGGSKENRHTPGTDHWSIAVKNGKAIEKEWRKEMPLPRGGPHRACVAVGDNLFVIGGQEGDFMPKPGSPIFKCSRRHEVVYGDVYMLDGKTMKWKVASPMPKPDSHIESSWIIWNNSIIIMGGTTEKHPVTKRMILVGEMFQFHLDTLKWCVMGKLPYRVKTTLAGLWDGWVYLTSGQRDRGEDNPQPKKVITEMWRTKLSFSCSPAID